MSNALSPELESTLRRELTRGERIIWQGQPAPVSRAFAAAGHFLFGIAFVAFAVYWTRLATQGQESTGWLGYLWGGAFVLIGATLLLSPVAAVWVARRTVYAVTDRCALLIERRLTGTTVRRFDTDLPRLVYHVDVLGRGSIIFDRVPFTSGKGRTMYRDVGFFGLDDADAVIRLLPSIGNVPSEDSSADRIAKGTA